MRYFDSLVKKEKKQDFHEWLYNFVFPRRDTTQQYGFTRDKTQFDNSSAFPFYLTDKTLTFQGGVKYYLSLEMYAKGNDSLIKKITEKGAFHVDPNRLKFLRCYLPIWYTASTLYEFTSASDVALYLEKKYFVLPDFNIDVKIKGRSSPIVKNVIESFFSIVDIARKIGRSGSKTATIVVDSLKSDSNKKLEEVRALWNKVNLKSITNVYENFFLYDLERIIQPKFVTELEKDFSIYGLISYSGENKEDNKLDLIKPTDSLKFQLLKDFYKNSLSFELGKAHEDRSFTVVGNRVFNLGLLRTRKHKPIGEKRPMTLEVIDTVRVLGVQDQNVNFINKLTISISSDIIIQELTKYKKYRYRFVLESLQFQFSSNLKNNTDIIFVSSEGLSNAKEALMNSKLQNVLGVCYLYELKSCEEVRAQPKRSQAIFVDSEQQQKASHLAFAFITRSFCDLLNFTITLLDDNGNKINFPNNEKKIPIIGFNKGIISDFKKLATKIQQDSNKVEKERDDILQACKKEYQKVCYENEALKKRCGELEQKIEELQQQKQQKPRRNLPKLMESKKPRKRYYVIPDENSEDSDAAANEEATEGEGDEDNDIQFVKVQKKKKKKPIEVEAPPPKKKAKSEKKKKKQIGIIDFVNS